MDWARESGLFINQPKLAMLFNGASAFWKSHRQRKARAGNQWECAHLPRRDGSGQLSQISSIKAHIAPTTARHETADPAQGQTERQSRRKYIEQIGQGEACQPGIKDHNQDSEDQPAVKNHSASAVLQRRPQTDAGRKKEKPTE